MTAPVVIAARLARHTAAALEALGDGRNAPAAGHIRKATKALEEAGPAWEEAECALFDIADYLESGPDWESLADTAASAADTLEAAAGTLAAGGDGAASAATEATASLCNAIATLATTEGETP